MSFTTEQKIDIAFKKLSGKGATDSQATKPIYLEPNTKTVHDAETILVDRDKIPTVAPTSPTNGQQYDVSGNAVASGGVFVYFEEQADVVAGKPESFTLASGLVFPFHFKNGAYAPTFFDDTGAQIFFGQNDMYFDADGGVLTFFEGAISTAYVTVKGFRYIGRNIADAASEGANIITLTRSLSSETLDTGCAYASGVFTFTHNLGTVDYDVFVYTSTSKYIHVTPTKNTNTVSLTFDVDPLDSHDLTIKLRRID